MKDKNVTLYIDAANLIMTARTFGLVYNIYWLLEYFKFRYKVNRCVYFTGRLETLKEDYMLLESQGVEIIFKEIYREEDGKTKANCDVEIAHRVTLDIEYNKVDKVILISGDGDFLSLLNHVQEKSKEVKLVGVHKRTTSRLYKEGMLFDLTYLTQIMEEINLDRDTPKEILDSLKGESLVGPLVPTRLFLIKDSISGHQNLSNQKSKIILFMATSLNGYIADESGSEDFLNHESWLEFQKEAEKVGNVVMGRKTYEAVMQWKDGYNFDDVKARKFILTSGDSFVKNGYDTINSPKEIYNRLPEQQDILLIGGAEINVSFLKDNLIDEVVIMINPVVLGKGKNLFAGADFQNSLILESCDFLKEDIIKVRYKVKQKYDN